MIKARLNIKWRYKTMKKAPILLKNTTVLHLYFNNANPHNMIYFTDTNFMNHVKQCLKDNNIHSITLNSDNGDRLKPYFNIFDYEYNTEIKGILYFCSSWYFDDNSAYHETLINITL